MAKFRVKPNNQVTKGGDTYGAGKVVDLTEKEAAEIPWAVEAVIPPIPIPDASGRDAAPPKPAGPPEPPKK